jgi:vacuolar-type H+-ATPase subunit I/STV1
MVNKTVKKESLGALAEKIAHCATQADEHTITAALLIREARKRVEAGEAGETTWYEWARNNIKLSMSRLRELQRIAEAQDPRKELERIRKKTQERVERHREKKRSAPLRSGGATVEVTAEMEDDRKKLIEWARSAPIGRVAEVLTYIRRFDSAEAVSNPDQPAEPAVT